MAASDVKKKGAGTGAGKKKAVETLIKKIKDDSADVRTEAWLGAGKVGAAAIPGLAEVMTDSDMEVARAAKRGMWQIVRHAGNPETANGKRNVVAKLTELLDDSVATSVRREVLWMLSEIGQAGVIEPMAALLKNVELREDARTTIERFGGPKAKSALSAALKEAPKDFKPNIAQSLRKLGADVKGYPCVKLKPERQTTVKQA
jgi:HEAT repeat protein